MRHYPRLAVASALVLSLAAAAPALSQPAPAKPAAAAKPAAKPRWPGLPPGAVEEYAVMRDGTRLAGNVFKPAGTGPWPVVMTRTPYIKDGRIDPEKDPKGVKNREAMVRQARRYTDAGYVFVQQ